MKKLKLSIRLKLIVVFGGLLAVSVVLHTLLASNLFRSEKTALLFEINHSLASNASSQLRSEFSQVADTLHLFTLRLLLPEDHISFKDSDLKAHHLTGVRVFTPADNAYKAMTTKENVGGTFDEPKGMNARLDDAQKKGFSLWRSTLTDGRNTFYFATRLIIDRPGLPTSNYLAVAQLDGNFFFGSLQTSNVFRFYLVNAAGDTLLTCEKGKLELPAAGDRHPLLPTILKARERGVSGVQEFEANESRWYGAYSPVGVGDLFVISQANQSEVERAVMTLIKESSLLGSIVVTALFLAALFLSYTLTRNLRILTEGSRIVGQGNLSHHVKVGSNDEISELAETLNQMVDSLKASRDIIEEYNRELEQKVADRTAELRIKNQEIKNQQEQLVKSSQLAAVGEIAGRAAHEVLNPLTAVSVRLESGNNRLGAGSGYNELLTEILTAWETEVKSGGPTKLAEALGVPSTVNPSITLLEEDIMNLKSTAASWDELRKKVTEDLNFVQDRTNHIQQILNGLREYSRASTNKAPEKVKEAVKTTCDMMQEITEREKIKINFQWNAQDNIAQMNKDEFTQILTNLMRNSVQSIQSRRQAQPDHKGEITVQGEQQGENLLVQIIDNGIGIEPDKQSRLFEYGFSTKAPSEGTGLGLSICRRYARAFGGEVNLHFSEPQGRGTCFMVTIPLSLEEAPQGSPDGNGEGEKADLTGEFPLPKAA